MKYSVYQCPICQNPLRLEDRTWMCDSNHCFDQHKKGYVNLLPVQKKRSKSPGDSAEMIASRRRFLEQGHYQPLAQHIATTMQQHLPAASRVWDAGCGEGYYTQSIAKQNPDFELFGLDISKPAIQAASSYKGIHWCVASSTHPPYLSESFDAIVSVFSRVDATPFNQVLKPSGTVLMVTPDSDHLLALRSLIYSDVRPYETSKHLSYFDDRFNLVDENRLEVPIQLENQQAILDLLGMTPHAHRLTTDIRDNIKKADHLDDLACFKIYRFEKR